MSCNTFILSTFFLFGLEHDFLLFIYATSFLNTSRKQMLKHNRIADKLQIVIICRTKYFFPRETTFSSRFLSINFAVVWLNVLLFFPVVQHSPHVCCKKQSSPQLPRVAASWRRFQASQFKW